MITRFSRRIRRPIQAAIAAIFLLTMVSPGLVAYAGTSTQTVPINPGQIPADSTTFGRDTDDGGLTDAVVWHFVLNGLDAGTAPGTLTAVFNGAGTKTATGRPVGNGSTQHFYVGTPTHDILTAASAVITLAMGDMSVACSPNLVLSHIACNDPEPGTIKAYKFHDHDGDGIKNGDEHYISGWGMTLKDASGATIATGNTNSDGYVTFGYLAPATYTLIEEARSGWAVTTVGGASVAITVAADQTKTHKFGNREVPPGTIKAYKFHDHDGDGIKNGDEHYISGWGMTLKDASGATIATGNTNSDGYVRFSGLTPGSYTVVEEQRSGWSVTTTGGFSVAVTAVSNQTATVKFGNKEIVPVKTWLLNLRGSVPKADSYFVRYVIGDAEPAIKRLTPGVGEAMPVAYGTTITSWQFFAVMGAEEIPLSGLLGPAERITADRTNDFTFVPGIISGHKTIQAASVSPGVGWTINLYRDGVFYASTETNDTGDYQFAGLLPGSYTVEEVQQAGYTKMLPVGDFLGPFAVVSGSVFSQGTDFVNAQLPASIQVTKTANPTLVHVGDDIAYTIDVTNNGMIDVLLTSVTDPMFDGGANLLAASVLLHPGESLSDFDLEIVKHLSAPDADMVDNTSYASGTSLFGPVTDDDDAHVDIIKPDISVSKSVTPTTLVDSGTVTYSVTVTNTGNTSLTIDVTDYIGAVVHKVLDTDLVLGPGEHKDYTWDEVVSATVSDTVEAVGVDVLGGVKGSVSADADATVLVELTKTWLLNVYDDIPNADSYFVRWVMNSISHDFDLTPGVGREMLVPYGATITSWQFFARLGAVEVPLSGLMGPETLMTATENSYGFVPGGISGVKYNDIDGDGSQDQFEEGMAGWTINLYRDGVSYDTTVTVEEGAYAFTGLLPGTYTLEEVQQTGWGATETPGEFIIGNETFFRMADFGNHRDVTKTSLLHYAAAPAGAEFWVVYSLDPGGLITVPLKGPDPYTATTQIPYGTVITGAWWWVSYQGEEIMLGAQQLNEPLLKDETNEFTYTASVSGHKFDDADGDGIWGIGESGLSDWTIGLYRRSSPDVEAQALPAPILDYDLYAQTLTGVGGAYAFSGLLPGTYYLAEEQQDGWGMTVAPDGPFVVWNGAEMTDMDFGNMEEFMPFTDTDLTKRADKTVANAGDLVTYTLTYSNIGDGIIEKVTITDDYDERYMTPESVAGATVGGGKLTWVDNVPLGAGDVRTITYTMRIKADMPASTTYIDNTAVIDPGFHKASWRVRVGEPYLPFTGGSVAFLSMIAAGALLFGFVLRRKARGV